MSKQLADAMRVLLQAYSAATYSDEKVGEDNEELCARQALEAFDARTFAQDCHDLADRAQVIERANPSLRPSLRPHELHMLRMLVAACRAVGDDAECAPELYIESPEPDVLRLRQTGDARCPIVHAWGECPHCKSKEWHVAHRVVMPAPDLIPHSGKHPDVAASGLPEPAQADVQCSECWHPFTLTGRPSRQQEQPEKLPAMLPLEAACLELAERLERIRTLNGEPPHRSLALSVTERELRSLARTWSK